MADHVTTRFGFTGLDPSPSALEYVNNWPSTLNALLDSIDAKLTGYSTGVIGSRPAAGTAGRVYLATDDRTSSPNGTLYFDNGTAWVIAPTNNYAAGTLAARPRSGTRGQFYYATDDRTVGANGTLYLFDGTGWNQVQSGPVSVATTGAGDSGLARGSFSAYRSAALSVVDSGTVIACDTEEWDVSSWHDTSTGRFTPQVAGYYRLTAAAPLTGSTGAELFTTSIRKNGTPFKSKRCGITAIGQAEDGFLSVQVSANGSTDYFDVFVTHANSGGLPVATGSASTYFQGELVGRS